MPTALTPRVRTLVVCDGIRASRIEANVYHLRGARTHIFAEAFPVRRRLRLFLILSSPRPGRYPSYVKIIDDQTDQAVFYGQVDPCFPMPRTCCPWTCRSTSAFRRLAGTPCSCGSFRRPLPTC